VKAFLQVLAAVVMGIVLTLLGMRDGVIPTGPSAPGKLVAPDSAPGQEASKPTPPAADGKDKPLPPPCVTVQSLNDLMPDEAQIVKEARAKGWGIYEVGDARALDIGHWSLGLRDEKGIVHYPCDRIVASRTKKDGNGDSGGASFKESASCPCKNGEDKCLCGQCNGTEAGVCHCAEIKKAKFTASDYYWRRFQDPSIPGLMLIDGNTGTQAGSYRIDDGTFAWLRPDGSWRSAEPPIPPPASLNTASPANPDLPPSLIRASCPCQDGGVCACRGNCTCTPQAHKVNLVDVPHPGGVQTANRYASKSAPMQGAPMRSGST
jgi:hypothetical protein